MAKRTVMRSSAGKKLYAVRAADGTFEDIQSYARAHAMDIARSSKAEKPAKKKTKKKAAKKGAKKAAKKTAKKAKKKASKKK
jgi:topoisomerase IA-like protein